MERVKKSNMKSDPRVGEKEIIPKDAQIIEQTLDSFGITARIVEINFRQKIQSSVLR